MDAPAIDSEVRARSGWLLWRPSPIEWVALLGALAPLFALAVTIAAAAAPAAQAREAALQEDAWVEWTTVFILLGTSTLFVRRGVGGCTRGDRAAAFALALFCVAFAGEELSWGQRLFGITPSPLFLEHNFQQELNAHNFLQAKDAPVRLESRHALAGVALLFAAGTLARTLLRRRPKGAALLDRMTTTQNLDVPSRPTSRAGAELLGALTPSPLQLPFYGLVLYLALGYPFPFAGEVAELVFASQLLWLGAADARPRTAVVAFIVPLLLGAAAPKVADAWYAKDAAGKREVARAELQALSVSLGARLTPSFFERRSVDKRLWSAERAGYFTGAERWTSEEDRARHFIDPWGSPYWIRRERGGDAVLYSFGPNRRRDGGGDDLSTTLRAR